MAHAAQWIFRNVLKALQAPVQALSAEYLRQKMIKELTHAEDLPDAMLRDVGLTRDEIRHAKHAVLWAGFGRTFDVRSISGTDRG